MKIPLYDEMFTLRDIFDPSSQENALSLRHCLRFDNKSPAFAFRLTLKVQPKLRVLRRQHPSQGEKVKLLRKALPQLHKAFAQQILPGDDVHAWISRLLPGKWLIFWCGSILNTVSGRTALSVHHTSQSTRCGSV